MTPRVLHTVLDAKDCRGLAEFYRELLALHYRAGDEPPADGVDDADWLVLLDDNEDRVLAVQSKHNLTPATWPREDVPMQAHLDIGVLSTDELRSAVALAERLGAVRLLDRSDDVDEPLMVLGDPEGHPFCWLVTG